MAKMISVGFTYSDEVHHALVRCRKIDGIFQIRVTIMNGDLEKKLFGNHIFVAVEGKIEPATLSTSTEVDAIRQAIISSLSASGEFFELYTLEYPSPDRQEDNSY